MKAIPLILALLFVGCSEIKYTPPRIEFVDNEQEQTDTVTKPKQPKPKPAPKRSYDPFRPGDST